MVYSCDFKIAAIKAYNYIASLRQVSNIFSVSISTLSRWNNAARHNTLLCRKSRPSKISDALVTFIKQLLINNPFVTRTALKNIIWDIFGISVSEALVGTCIQKAGFTKKKTRSRPCKEAGTKNIEEFLSEFMEARRSHKRIISIDETGFDDTSLPHMGYSLKGSRLVIKHPRTSWKRTSVTAAVCTSGTIKISPSDKPVNGETFELFLSSIDLPEGSILLMDNIAFHKTKKVRDLVSSRGWKILFTPPYSPWFNPIENIFSVAKNTFRRVNARDINRRGSSSSGISRHVAVQDAFAAVTSELITSCFRHVDDVCHSTVERLRSYTP